MSTISEYFEYARLADAAYVNLSTVTWSIPAAVANQAVSDQKLPRKLADATFNTSANGWQVAHYYDAENPTTGFAATLFKNSAGRYVLGVRGTETEPVGQAWIDLIKTDLGEIGFVGFALKQTVSMVNYILRLQGDVNSSSVLQFNLRTSGADSPPVGVQAVGVAGSWFWLEGSNNTVGLGKIPPGTQIDITGHSLGGHLAALATRLFPPSLVNEAVVFNAPGFDPTTGQIATDLNLAGPPMRLTDEFMGLFAQRMTVAPSFRNVTMLDSEDTAAGSDTDIVSGWLTGAPLGPTQYVAVEKNSHGMGQIADSLSLQRLFHRLDPAMGLASFEMLYRSASNEDRTAVESLLATLEEAKGVGVELFPRALHRFRVNDRFGRIRKSATGRRTKPLAR
jgi:hypothetical protein